MKLFSEYDLNGTCTEDEPADSPKSFVFMGQCCLLDNEFLTVDIVSKVVERGNFTHRCFYYRDRII